MAVVLPIKAKQFVYDPCNEKNGGILPGILTEPGVPNIEVSGYRFNPQRKDSMLNLLSISIASNSFLFPSLVDVEHGLAIYKEIEMQWDSFLHIDGVCQKYEVARFGRAVHFITIASPVVNQVFSPLLNFVLGLHVQGLVLERFSSADFIIVKGDIVPKLWKTGIFRPEPDELHNSKLSNFDDLASFFLNMLTCHFKGRIPNYLELYARRLREGNIECVKNHVQMKGFGYTAICFKYLLDQARGILTRKDILENEWIGLTNEFAHLVVLEESKIDYRWRALWRNKMVSDQDSLMWVTYSFQHYEDDISELFRLLRNLLTHLSDDHGIDAFGLYFVIEDKFQNLIVDFMDRLQWYRGLAGSLEQAFSQ